MIQSILSNFAILFLMHIVIEKLESSRTYIRREWINVLVVIVVSVSVISMFYLPISFNGYHFDLRFIPLLFIALNRPRRITLTILLIVIIFRWIMGGEGALPGIIYGLVLPTLFTMLFRIKKYNALNLFSVLLICTVDWIISDLPIIFIVPNGWQIFEQMAVLRYTAFIVATIVLYVLIYNARTRIQLETQLMYESKHDQLTGTLNKNALLATIRQRMTNRDFAFIAMIDVDFFKLVNDQFGHMTGDKILKEIAEQLHQSSDREPYFALGRYGGEEFIYYLEVNTLEEAIAHLDEVRNRIKLKQFYSVKGEPIFQITVSMGVSEIENKEIDRGLEKADHQLYLAKESGRNCIKY